jgi:drug/metabolite transporter (DMT)-like permease
LTALSFTLVIFSSLLHASWNFLTKRSEDKQIFLWWAILISVLIYLPPLLYLAPQVNIPTRGWYYIAATGLIHTLYFFLLGGAYEQGDLSLVYPLARGLGPLLVPILAWPFLKEKLSWVGVLGILLAAMGIYVLQLKSFSPQKLLAPLSSIKEKPSQLAMMIGITISLYSVIDKKGVSLVHPFVYIYLMFLISGMLLTPYMVTKKRESIREEWRRSRRNIIAVAFVDMFTYLLILVAMTISKVSYIASARSASIVFGALLGTLLLGEPYGQKRIMGSSLIVIGVALLGLAR